MLKLKFRFDKNILKFPEFLLMLLILTFKTDIFSSLSSPRKFWSSSRNMWCVLRFWILVFKKCKSGSLELSKYIFSEFSKGLYLRVSKFWSCYSLLTVSLVITSIFKDKNHTRKIAQINVYLYTIVISHYDASVDEACKFILLPIF